VLFILLLPLSKEYRLLIFGQRTYGEIAGYHAADSAYNVYSKNVLYYTLINFNTENESYIVPAPRYMLFEEGSVVKIIYDKNNPDNYIIASFEFLYTSPIAIIAGVILLVWIAFYSTFGVPKVKNGGYKILSKQKS